MLLQLVFVCFSTKLIQIIRYTTFLLCLFLFSSLVENVSCAFPVATPFSLSLSLSLSLFLSEFLLLYSSTSTFYAATKSSSLNDDNELASRTPVGEYTSTNLPNSSVSSFTFSLSLLPCLIGTATDPIVLFLS